MLAGQMSDASSDNLSQADLADLLGDELDEELSVGGNSLTKEQQ